ncbi:MAG: ABC transporter substrate-binding protein [Desulfuromonadales bacterium]|nr:ABC transporter substrate-binding protein [Desulfuromonadales bacterium]
MDNPEKTTLQPNGARRYAALRPLARFTGISLRDIVVTVGPITLLTVIVIGVAFWIVRPAPPNTITIAAGTNNSTFRNTAEKYRKILARNGITLKIIPTGGSLDNLHMLSKPDSKVDVGFVQGGVSSGIKLDHLVSLGSVFHEPLTLFYRTEGTDGTVERISELAGKRLAIGPQGSGTRVLALILLKANGIEPGGATTLLDIGGEEAADALVARNVDAAFLMGDSATPAMIRKLLWSPGVQMVNFSQAEAYTRRYPYLNKISIPMGALDFGKNVPVQDVQLIAPTVELVARESLHPALSDLLIEAAREVHGSPSLMRRAGEFPSLQEHEYRISDDARRYYSSGKSFFYRNLPFWLASLMDRLLVVVVPIVILLIPGLKLAPALYSWRIKSRIYRWYGILIALERSMLAEPGPEERQTLLKELDEVEAGVNRMKVPLAYTEQYYVLRDHIMFVRNRYRGF